MGFDPDSRRGEQVYRDALGSARLGSARGSIPRRRAWPTRSPPAPAPARASTWAPSTDLSVNGMLPPVWTRTRITAVTAGALLMLGGGALAAGAPDPLGSPGAASLCKRPQDSSCATVRETTHGHLSVINVVAPTNVA